MRRQGARWGTFWDGLAAGEAGLSCEADASSEWLRGWLAALTETDEGVELELEEM